MLGKVKLLIPSTPRELPILAGPLAGGKFVGSPRVSLRKMLGIYEHELNDWLRGALTEVNTLVDVGANDGYFAFGCAQVFLSRRQSGRVYCFEPDAVHLSSLERAAGHYRAAGIAVEIWPYFLGNLTNDSTVTLSELEYDGHPALIKIDVEGAELSVLEGSGLWLNKKNFWLIEVHSEQLLRPIREIAFNAGIHLRQIDQRPHWLLGRESRDKDNRWLVSDI